MISEPIAMTCDEFQALLPEMIGSGVDVQTHPHFRDCQVCRRLLADLEAIAAAASKLLPVEEPRDTLWDQIEQAIEVDEALQRSGRTDLSNRRAEAG